MDKRTRPGLNKSGLELTDAELAKIFSSMKLSSPKSKAVNKIDKNSPVLLGVTSLQHTDTSTPIYTRTKQPSETSTPTHTSLNHTQSPFTLIEAPKLNLNSKLLSTPEPRPKTGKLVHRSPDPWADSSPTVPNNQSAIIDSGFTSFEIVSPPQHHVIQQRSSLHDKKVQRSPGQPKNDLETSRRSIHSSSVQSKSFTHYQDYARRSPRSMSVEVGETGTCDRSPRSRQPKPSRSLDYTDEKRTVAVTDLDKFMEEMTKNGSPIKSEDVGEKSVHKINHGSNMVSLASLQAEIETDLDAIEVENITQKQPCAYQSNTNHLKPPVKKDNFFRAPLASPETILSSSPTSQLTLEERPPITVAVTPKKPLQHTASIHLTDVVSYPKAIPGKLDFRNLDVFEGQMLLQWFISAFGDDHYLSKTLTLFDKKVVATQFCTHLSAANVIKQLDDREGEGPLFKPNCLYYWTHTQTPSSNQIQEPGKLTPQWPPTQPNLDEMRPGLKYTEADHQTAMVGLRHEYRDELEKLQNEHETWVAKLQDENEKRMFSYRSKINALQEQLEKYRILAGIEQLTQSALSDADDATKEINGLHFRSPGETPSVSQYHTPAATPEVLGRSLSQSVGAKDDICFNDITSDLQSALIDTPDKTVPPPAPPLPRTAIPPAPPPPIPGSCIPPPPPLPGSAIPPPPPPPPPVPGVPSAPPPPPVPGGPPSPPPPPPVPGDPPPPPRIPGAPPAPPPPPGIPPPPGGGPPPPPSAGFTKVEKVPVKPVIKTRSPMKPLFWKRIQVQQLRKPPTVNKSDSKFLWEEIKEPLINVEEFDELFSKMIKDESKKTATKTQKKKQPKQVAKLIDVKRSQSVGILLSTLRMDMSEIETAILGFDSSALDSEKLQALFDAKPLPEELKMIQAHLDKNNEISLDKPEQFLYDMSQIPEYADRIFCFIYHTTFQENISEIENKLNNLKMTTEVLISGSNVKNVLGIILALGNYMNGGNGQRGQADGFGLDILAKLRDVKSKDNQMSLLQYVVSQYVRHFEKDDAGSDKVKMPLPEPSDVRQASLIEFDGIENDLKQIKRNLEGCERKSEKIISNASEMHVEPFKTIMTTFFEKASQDVKDQEENITDCKTKFTELVEFYCVKPKTGESVVSPEAFFSLWTNFCSDFKDLWKREQQKVLKQRLKEAQNRVKQIHEERRARVKVEKRARKVGGLKDRLAAKGKI